MLLIIFLFCKQTIVYFKLLLKLDKHFYDESHCFMTSALFEIRKLKCGLRPKGWDVHLFVSPSVTWVLKTNPIHIYLGVNLLGLELNGTNFSEHMLLGCAASDRAESQHLVYILCCLAQKSY